ncbi:MAG TPA: isoleucine--tRNA ligase [Pseudomonadales bacterium]|nr:isoleucine--tRNA ligase [Pseudomonadales bacterium]
MAENAADLPEGPDADQTARSGFSFVAAEHEVLEFWARERVFERSLEQTRDAPPYIFYDGPPFATGLPHHGHLVASTIKDIIPRYFTMQGRYVQRRFGWDCHGLPVEQEINKQYEAEGLNAHNVVEALGVKGYNDACRAIVQRYTSEWRETITRIGRWVDFDHDYKTMDPWYMESVWWVVKQLWEQDLIYQGQKIVPVSTALGTGLSNFEANLNYKDVQDPAITVLLELEEEDAYLAIWTTTPWTLPSNLAVCVGPDIDYVKARDTQRGIHLYLAADRFEHYAKRHQLEIVERIKGSDLEGRRYRPLFPYFADQVEKGAFVVITGDYVTADDGTGLVHQAPAFGEDDYNAFRTAGIDAFAMPVTLEGRFTDEVPDFAGQHVKEADKDIIRHLKDAGTLFEQDVIDHSYPFCYRSDTPLIYCAVPSWYVKVESLRERLLASNAQINWVPEHIKDGRFGNWLDGARDWAISRNRVWGTPLPLWVNDVSGKVLCIGSIDELAQYSGVRVDDLHRENVDALDFAVDGEEGTYRRIPEVLDCWFESGSMPYAQLHYPFENADVFEAGFPAEFIAEGLDQTRGWFYTLTVLATALYDKPAFRNVIVNGLVLAEDGTKMSKSKRNYTAPGILMEEFGADALRLYLINSGLVKGEEQRFADAGVRDMTRRALLPWYNAFNFLDTYAGIDAWNPSDGLTEAQTILDRWILSRLQTLKSTVTTEMEAYRLYNVVPRLFEFIEELTNTYIRLNRGRFWGEARDPDKLAAYSTLYVCLLELSQTMAPFAPFLSETLYRQLRALGGRVDADLPDSVHLCRYPAADATRIDARLEAAVDRMNQIILLGRQKREEVRIGLRQPLARLTVIHRDADLLAEIAHLETYLAGELNVKRIEYSTDESAFIRLFARPNFKRLGKRLGKRMKAFQAQINALDADTLEAFAESGSLELDGERFDLDDIEVLREARENTQALSNRYISIDLDTELTAELVAEGLAREAVNRIQRARKEADLRVADRIEVRFHCDAELRAALEAHADYVSGETLATAFAHDDAIAEADGQRFDVDVDGRPLAFAIRVVAAAGAAGG